MSDHPEIREAARRLTSTFVFAGSIAALVVLLGTRDMESYEHAVFSLNRGTSVDTVRVLGHPVYTLGLGLGVRLPLQGSLDASPAAVLAPVLPVPLTYWLLLVFSIGAAAILVRHALEPLCGRQISWLALVLLFCSAPMVNYTIYDDWVEVAVTYPAFIGCIFAPHALLALLDRRASTTSRRVAGVGVAAILWGLVAISHPGYWPLLAGALSLAFALALGRSDHSLRTRLAVVAALGAVSLLAVAIQAPDIFRELDIANKAGGMRRFVEGPRGSLLGANAFPFGQPGARFPFMYMVLALASLVLGLTSRDAHLRRMTVGGALAALLLGVAAVTLSPGRSWFAPSVSWALRDPAVAFAVFSGACAAGLLRRARLGSRLIGAGPAAVALALAGLQGPAYAASLVRTGFPDLEDHRPWTHDMTPAAERISRRGLPRDRVLPGERLALWPEVRDTMRNAKRASTDFADAGYLLVTTVWTKQRTMRGLIEPNEILFNQFVNLSPQILCDVSAVQFLQLRYLLLPPETECMPWTPMPGLQVDGWLNVGIAPDRDDRVRALSADRLTEPLGREPALSAGSRLLPALTPLPGTSVHITSTRVTVGFNDPSVADGQALVLPVAFDPAWHASSGRVQNVGGLLALIGVDRPQVTLEFVPDRVARLRALSMTLAQVLAFGGLLVLGCVRLSDDR